MPHSPIKEAIFNLLVLLSHIVTMKTFLIKAVPNLHSSTVHILNIRQPFGTPSIRSNQQLGECPEIRS
jgi:hypothetical protein